MGDFCLAFNESLNMSEPNIQAPVVMNNGTTPIITPPPQQPVTTTQSSSTSTNNTNSTSSASTKSSKFAGNGSSDKPKGSRTGRSSKK